MSSQTTDTPGTTNPQQEAGSLRSNFSNLPEQPDLCKSAFPRFPIEISAPPDAGTLRSVPFSGCYQGGWPPRFSAPGCLTRGDSEDITRPQARAQIDPNTIQKPRQSGPKGTSKDSNQPKGRENNASEARHIRKDLPCPR
ncbi:hypothetical protein ARTHRO9V_20181 [Arthrobacter sp. 9V]|nr:hypothetical protein ARTHRO9V_20181 [Arthrobacter sp. 9V]